MEKWFKVYITDKNGKVFFKNICSVSSFHGVETELKMHLKAIKENSRFYENMDIDRETAQIVKEDD